MMMTQNFTLPKLLMVGCLCMLPLGNFAQISDDFENGSLEGWFSEGDGRESLSTTLGNPGASFKIDDDATGDINYAIAPRRYLGDWLSDLTSNDTLSVDIYVQSSDPDTLVDDFPVFQLSGPGGVATALDGLNLPRNTWNQVKVPLDSTEWNIQSGSWRELLKGITLFRIRAEYITGNENVYLDNVNLSLSPTRGVLTDTICATFEDGTYDGWEFVENGPLTIDSIHGNPGIGIGIGDANGLTQAVAPPKYLGDWSALLDSGFLSFDLKVDNTSGGGLYNKEYLLRLSGNGAVAQVRPADSILNLAVDQWHTFTFLIDSSEWQMVTGSWDSLIVSVEEVNLELEFIVGQEVASLDNFCLIPKTRNTTTSLTEPKLAYSIRVFPNPAAGRFSLLSSEANIESISLYDLAGRSLPAVINFDGHEAQVETDYQGLAIVKVKTDRGVMVQKVQLVR